MRIHKRKLNEANGFASNCKFDPRGTKKLVDDWYEESEKVLPASSYVSQDIVKEGSAETTISLFYNSMIKKWVVEMNSYVDSTGQEYTLEEQEVSDYLTALKIFKKFVKKSKVSALANNKLVTI